MSTILLDCLSDISKAVSNDRPIDAIIAVSETTDVLCDNVSLDTIAYQMHSYSMLDLTP